MRNIVKPSKFQQRPSHGPRFRNTKTAISQTPIFFFYAKVPRHSHVSTYLLYVGYVSPCCTLQPTEVVSSPGSGSKRPEARARGPSRTKKNGTTNCHDSNPRPPHVISSRRVPTSFNRTSPRGHIPSGPPSSSAANISDANLIRLSLSRFLRQHQHSRSRQRLKDLARFVPSRP